jgi:5-methylcytosine-specific restriction endonuclease McrA
VGICGFLEDLVLQGLKMKICSFCKKVKQRSHFHKNRARHDGLCNRCKECSSKRSKDELARELKCVKCKNVQPASTEYFRLGEKIRFASRCKVCDKNMPTQEEKKRIEKDARDEIRRNNPIKFKIYEFRYVRNKSIVKIKKVSKTSWRRKVSYKVSAFFQTPKYQRPEGKHVPYKQTFTTQDFLDKIGENPTCYLTGDPINIEDTFSYNIDHIMPRSQGGSNDIENANICTRRANMSKTDMTYEEYIEHCRKVIAYHEQKTENDRS